MDEKLGLGLVLGFILMCVIYAVCSTCHDVATSRDYFAAPIPVIRPSATGSREEPQCEGTGIRWVSRDRNRIQYV